ncbi:LacI family DNA-binding transcriptional regulator [Arthrobacter monumenti]
MAGIKDVAARAGVSTATVSRALSGNGHVSATSRQRVLDAAAELDFVLSYHASSLASGRSRNIGVIVPSVDRWFFSQVVGGIAGALLDVGYDLTLYNTARGAHHQESVLKDYLMRQRLDAVIPVALKLNQDELARLLSVNRPVVGIGGAMPGVPTVSVDHFGMGSLATGHLIGLGHKKIAHITGGPDADRDFELTGSRRGGYETEMVRADLDVNPSWVVVSDFTVNDAHRQAKQLLASPYERPSAIFCASDEMAIGAILAARELGLNVPEDLSVIGIDGHDLSEVFGLTTINQFPQRQGERAVQRLLAALSSAEKETGPLNEKLDTEFVVRSSTAVPASG